MLISSPGREVKDLKTLEILPILLYIEGFPAMKMYIVWVWFYDFFKNYIILINGRKQSHYISNVISAFKLGFIFLETPTENK